MTRHVDVIDNDWANGEQRVVGRAAVEEGELEVLAINDEWLEIIRRPILDHATGETIDPDEEPKRFLEELHTGMSGSYSFATPLHDDHDCTYRVDVGEVVRLTVDV